MREALEQVLASPKERRAKSARRATRFAVALGAALAATAAVLAARSNAPQSVAMPDPTAPAPPATPPPSPPPTPSPEAEIAAAQADLAAPVVVDSLPAVVQVHAPARVEPEAHVSRADRLNDARRVAKGHMSDAHALKLWATAAYRAGELREARRAAEVWTLHDGTAEPRIFLATVLDASGRRSEAKAILEEWLQLHPDSPDARQMHARLGAPIPSDSQGRKQVARR
jgi:glucose/arabinose dehydrogenase